MEAAEVALEEYKALRAEIVAHQQAQTTTITFALTALAAIGGVAFGGATDHIELLLVLPIVLSGLGLKYLRHADRIERVERYIRRELWPGLARLTTGGRLTVGWEKYDEPERGLRAVWHPTNWLRWMPGVVIFGLPSVAALAINAGSAPKLISGNAGHKQLGRAWGWDVGFLAIAAVMLVVVGFSHAWSSSSTSRSSRL